MTEDTARAEARRETRHGVFYAIAAYGFWGVNPIYFKLVSHVPALEVVAHRVIWSLLLVGLLVLLARRGRALLDALRDRRTLLLLALSTLIISVNWLIYIWAIYIDRVLETSLGYYINPLVSVLLGVAVLGERLTRLQMAAVVLAALGVANLAIGIGGLPWIALSLAFTFGIYGLIRKTVKVGSVDGLLVETALLLPVALAFLGYLAVLGTGSFATLDRWTDLLLILAGPVTMLPLIWFTSAARRLPLSLVGFFQYIAPTCHFVLAVFVFGEPFTKAHLITFLLIWSAVALFVGQSWINARAERRLPA